MFRAAGSLAEEFQVSARLREAELVTLKLRRGLSGSLGESLGSWEGSGAERGCQNFCVTCSFGNWAVRGNELVALTYKRYPYTATRSEIAERVLAGDAAALERISSARPGADGPRVQTIGYEGHTLESYLNVLLQAGVSLLCDVRRNPISRKYGFSKKALSKGCEGVGLGYEHVPELGIDSSQRRNLNTQSDYDALFAEYERDALPPNGGTRQARRLGEERRAYRAHLLRTPAAPVPSPLRGGRVGETLRQELQSGALMTEARGDGQAADAVREVRLGRVSARPKQERPAPPRPTE